MVLSIPDLEIACVQLDKGGLKMYSINLLSSATAVTQAPTYFSLDGLEGAQFLHHLGICLEHYGWFAQPLLLLLGLSHSPVAEPLLPALNLSSALEQLEATLDGSVGLVLPAGKFHFVFC